MRSYFLIDGMMVYDALRANRIFRNHEANWWQPLLPGKAHRLTGPLLIDLALVKQAGETVNVAVVDLIDAFPCRLHLSTLHSEADLTTLTIHLRRFAAYYDEDVTLLGLRFADCRRVVDLPHVMTAAQWGDLTSLIDQWLFHDRHGKEAPLTLPEDRASLESDQALSLSNAQIAKLMQASAADKLLLRLQYTPQRTANDLHGYWQLSQQCVSLWRQSGSRDEDVLFYFARKVFASQGRALQDNDWQAVLASATPQDVINS